MSKIVEIVARAICQAREQNGGPPWEYWLAQPDSGKHVLNAFRDDARAAITALREPDPEMILASINGDYAEFWRRMIDAALGESRTCD